MEDGLPRSSLQDNAIYPAERVTVRRGNSGSPRPKAANDNAPSLMLRLLKAARWTVLIAVILAVAWSLLR